MVFFITFTTMYAQLGNIKFESAKGFTSLEETFGVNYAQHERIKGKPRLEAVGSNLDTVSFSMYLHSQFTTPEDDIEQMRINMVNNEVLPLVLGNGKVVGSFVITNFSVTTMFTDPVGNLIEASLSVELLENFTEDPLGDSKKKAVSNAFATSARNSKVRAVTAPNLSQGMVVSDNVSEIQTSAKIVNQYVASVEKNPETVAYYSKKIGETLRQMEGGLAKVNNTLDGSPSISDLGPNMPFAIDGVNTSVQDMKSALPISNINSFKNLSSALQSATNYLKITSVQIDKQSIIRRL